MKITQISVFLENRSGRMRQVCSVLGQNNINIRALTVAETESFGVLRIVVDKPAVAIDVLKKNGFTANITDVVVVEMQDKPGGLADILGILDENKINVEYMYAFLEKSADKAMVVFRFEHPEKAVKVLTDNNVTIAKDITV
jgi:hypothetical protein